jgi:Ser/Thr protein kinase RdoA (MazF antagonist)
MKQNMWGESSTQLFTDIEPDVILKCVDELGLKSTGRVMALNSLENRVYEVEIDNPNAATRTDTFVIIKFYRPGRWSREQILAEHEFLNELLAQEISVIAPLSFGAESLFLLPQKNIFYALFPKRGGRNPDEFNEEMLQVVGRTIGRMHLVGKSKTNSSRLKLDVQTYGLNNLDTLLKEKLIPAAFEAAYAKLVEEICKVTRPLFDRFEMQRIHGDCHRGNILWRPEGIYLLDFDDMVIGPVVQDIWPITPGRDAETKLQREILLEAYEEFCSFDYASLCLIEPLRTLRFIHFAAWIGKRFNDESFKKVFPYYGTEQYWSQQVSDLREQLELIKDETII